MKHSPAEKATQQRGRWGFKVSLLLLALCALACQSSGPSAVDRADLVPLMETDLSRFAPQIQEQLSDERRAVENLLGGSPSTDELALAFGDLGRLFHAYGLHPPALVCYRNAAALDPQEPRWSYLEAVIQQNDGALDAASGLYTRARGLLAQAPAAARRGLELRLATVFADLNKPEEATPLLRGILQQDDSVAAAHFTLGRLASSRGDTEQAVEHFERSLELQPQATAVHYLLGVAYRRLGEADKAQANIDAMGAVGTSFPDPWVDGLKDLVLGIGPHLDRAQRAVEGGRFEEAKKEYRAALALEPQNSTAWRGLGYTQRKAGEWDSAAQTLRDMLVIYPQDTAARLELATTLLEADELDAAVSEYEAALAIDPTFGMLYLNLGVAKSRQGFWSEALDLFRKALELDSKNAKARFHLAITLDELGRTEESLEQFERSAQENPDDVAARQRLGLEWLKRGQLDRAAGEHRAVLALVDAPPEEKALAHYQLAQIADRRADLDAALEHYGQARQLFPGLWQAALSYGNTLKQAGRYAEAAREYRFLTGGEPSNVQYRQLEVQMLMRAGDFPAAAQRLAEGLAQLPRAAELGHLKARLLAVATDERLRNGIQALELATQIFEAFPSLEHGETVAMALAEQRRFVDALQWQQRLIEQARREGREDLLPRLQRNFDAYGRGEPAQAW